MKTVVEKAEDARLIREAHEAEVAQKNKTRNMLIGGGLLALLLAGGFYSRSRYIKKIQRTLSQKKRNDLRISCSIFFQQRLLRNLRSMAKPQQEDLFTKFSILFTDFKQFTQLSEKLSAKELVEETETIASKHLITYVRNMQ